MKFLIIKKYCGIKVNKKIAKKCFWLLSIYMQSYRGIKLSILTLTSVKHFTHTFTFLILRLVLYRLLKFARRILNNSAHI